MGVVSWIVLGAAAGCIAGRIAVLRLPGGVWAAVLAGMAGGFVAAGTTTVSTGGNAAAVEPLGAIAAVAGAVLLVLMVSRATRAQPRAEDPSHHPTEAAHPLDNGERSPGESADEIRASAGMGRSPTVRRDAR
jgi:uncharacterized membrane protein YeaQ/YmgE (transglycosylase-associated protein family)